MRDHWLVRPGSKVALEHRDPTATPGAPGGHAETEAALPALHDRLWSLQGRLWGEHRRSLLVILQGMDASGKDGTITHVFQGVNPLGTKAHAFKAPTEEERDHDFLWRVHRVMPRAGEIGILNRSHYEDVLSPRVRRTAPERVWRPRYQHINNFEAMLNDSGTTLVKCFLHISKHEQGIRLQERIDEPDKRWKMNLGDLDDRARWKDYLEAYEEILERTSSEAAPWYLIPADHKWYRNFAVSHILVETLADMDPQFPDVPELQGLKIDAAQPPHPQPPTHP